MKIGTYVEQSIDHEMSANIIDLCPVGALNNKPYRYSARAWEMIQHEAVSPHDCVGSNMYAHVLRGTVKRIVPRSNEAINETWLADRDRFSYEGIYSPDRLQKPQLKENGEWRDAEWEEALDKLAGVLGNAAGDKIGFLASPSVTLEEAWLTARLAEHLGTSNLDHRVGRRDFSNQDADPIYPYLGCDIADLEQQGAILVVGSNIRHEAPILAHRLRKASLNGASISFANSEPYEYFFDVANYLSGAGLVEMLAGVAVAANGNKKLPANIADLCDGVKPSDDQKSVAAALQDAEGGLVLLGNIASRHGAFAALRDLAAFIAATTGTKLGFISHGANSAGAHLAGVLPHRAAGGKVRSDQGLDAAAMATANLDALLLLNVEPGADIDVEQQGFVAALTPFDSETLRETADLLLPIGTFAETSGTYVNVAGTWQSFAGVASPVGEARPAWKVLRVLGNLVDADDFEYVSSEDVCDEAAAAVGELAASNEINSDAKHAAPNGADAVSDQVDVPIYEVDAIVRRAAALQMTVEAKRSRASDE